ncbi:glycoside hydrolase family 18 protein [Alternaria alternata]|nr:glycoside hydrolase family 18 protein [Alternaria alternata]
MRSKRISGEDIHAMISRTSGVMGALWWMGYLQPFLPGAEVPGAPVSDLEITQKSSVMPHWPQILQQTFSGQGLRVARSVPADGWVVPFIFSR